MHAWVYGVGDSQRNSRANRKVNTASPSQEDDFVRFIIVDEEGDLLATGA